MLTDHYQDKKSDPVQPGQAVPSVPAAASEQHPLTLSAALHLLPGILTGTAFFLLAPIARRNGLPALWAHGAADLFVLLPFMFGILFYQGYKRNGRLSLTGVVLYRARIPGWQYLVFVPLVFFSSALVLLFQPVTDFSFDRLFFWWPAMYDLSFDLRGYSASLATATYLFSFLMVCLLAPLAEEFYFRGYLLPRLSRFGFWAVPIHTTLFALFHVWSPWLAVARAIGAIPFAYVAQRKQNIYIGLIAHILFNTVDVVMGLLLYLGYS